MHDSIQHTHSCAMLGLVDLSLWGCLLTDQNGWQRDQTTKESSRVRKETHISWSWSGRLFPLHPRDTAEADQLGAVFVNILCHLKAEMVGERWQSISPEALSPYWTQKEPVTMSAAPWHFPSMKHLGGEVDCTARIWCVSPEELRPLIQTVNWFWQWGEGGPLQQL